MATPSHAHAVGACRRPRDSLRSCRVAPYILCSHVDLFFRSYVSWAQISKGGSKPIFLIETYFPPSRSNPPKSRFWFKCKKWARVHFPDFRCSFQIWNEFWEIQTLGVRLRFFLLRLEKLSLTDDNPDSPDYLHSPYWINPLETEVCNS